MFPIKFTLNGILPICKSAAFLTQTCILYSRVRGRVSRLISYLPMRSGHCRQVDLWWPSAKLRWETLTPLNKKDTQTQTEKFYLKLNRAEPTSIDMLFYVLSLQVSRLHRTQKRRVKKEVKLTSTVHAIEIMLTTFYSYFLPFYFGISRISFLWDEVN